MANVSRAPKAFWERRLDLSWGYSEIAGDNHELVYSFIKYKGERAEIFGGHNLVTQFFSHIEKAFFF